MRFGLAGGVFAVLAVAALLLAYGALFSVYQTHQAIVVRLGEPVRTITEPGLHAKIPLIDTVITIDKRILDLEAPAQEVNPSDQKRLVVDAFARYRIENPLRFYQALGTVPIANAQLANLLNSALRRVLGEVTFIHVVRDERASLMNRIRELLDREANAFGIQIVDVRIRRADLPEENSQAIFSRMVSERQQQAAQYRGEGAEAAQTVRANADRERTVIVAEAQRNAQRVRGDGDAESIRVYADAFGQDKEFFAFYRSMQAYRDALNGRSTSFVLTPDSGFFRFFDKPGAATGKEAARAGSP